MMIYVYIYTYVGKNNTKPSPKSPLIEGMCTIPTWVGYGIVVPTLHIFISIIHIIDG